MFRSSIVFSLQNTEMVPVWKIITNLITEDIYKNSHVCMQKEQLWDTRNITEPKPNLKITHTNLLQDSSYVIFCFLSTTHG